MTPDELTCEGEGEGAVVWQYVFEQPHTTSEVATARETYRRSLSELIEPMPWGVDFCPECGRGGEVGRL